MNMEQGIKLNFTDFKEIKNNLNLLKKYQWVYIGTEFCENLLPLYLKHVDKIEYIPNKNICFLTPPFTDSNKKILTELLLKLSKYNQVKEISANDIGIFQIIKKLNLNFKTNIGRHLSKNIIIFKKNTFTIKDPETLFFLNSQKINRYDISQSSPAISNSNIKKLDLKHIKFTLHTPIINLSTTRLCILGIKNINHDEDPVKLNCNYECLKGKYMVQFKGTQKLIVDGNTLFKNSEYSKIQIKNIYKNFFDRIIYHI